MHTWYNIFSLPSVILWSAIVLVLFDINVLLVQDHIFNVIFDYFYCEDIDRILFDIWKRATMQKVSIKLRSQTLWNLHLWCTHAWNLVFTNKSIVSVVVHVWCIYLVMYVSILELRSDEFQRCSAPSPPREYVPSTQKTYAICTG